ncbi:MAG: hypothetical protein IJY69_04050 [Clostridia bacterium]|nr:hypothetical protein [Clostridia bacterium]
MVSVKDYGALGDGKADDFAAIQAALQSGDDTVLIPAGEYHVYSTLTVGSNMHIIADKCARIVMKSKKRRARGEFLLSNSDPLFGNENITIEGGIWDGCNTDPAHKKPDLFDKNGYSGAVINLVGVSGLKLSGMVVSNSVTYYIRMSKIENFIIEDIDFVSDNFGVNQDGLHFGGGVRRGRVKNIRALTAGQTNDDMIALNADDSVERVENLDIQRDAIEDISFENIYAENCYTIVRLLSITAPIRRISFKNISCGFRCYAINADGARYCKTPLFKEEDKPDGVGEISDISFDGFTCRPITDCLPDFNGAKGNCDTAISLESRMKNVTIRGFRYICDRPENYPALTVKNLSECKLNIDKKHYTVVGKDDVLRVNSFEELKIN